MINIPKITIQNYCYTINRTMKVDYHYSVKHLTMSGYFMIQFAHFCNDFRKINTNKDINFIF